LKKNGNITLTEMLTRRKFLWQSIATAAAGSALGSMASCGQSRRTIGTLSGPNSSLGHQLRSNISFAPKITSKKDYVIVGGGIAGLSAARQLAKGKADFYLLELEKQPGGNSNSSTNQFTSYPLGAHYLPLPNLANHDLLEFLQETGVITGYENGLPKFNDLYLCFDPKERLYINEHWQEGLIPQNGVPTKDLIEIEQFLSKMEDWRNKRGRDLKFAFNIPVEESSSDPEFLMLDLISMGQWLLQNNFTSSYLRWYVDYCCSDDFGATAKNVSAWAGLHYFASRKTKELKTHHETVLTWSEGNGWLTNKLKENSSKQVMPECLAYQIIPKKDHVSVLYYNNQEKEFQEIQADKVIMATPQFANKHILQLPDRLNYSAFEYAPWMVANLTITGDLNEKRGESLSWDNVVYNSESLGYVNAMHQHLDRSSSLAKKVITYYKPLTTTPYSDTRSVLGNQKWEDWLEMIVKDLQGPHPKLKDQIDEINVWHWGHGMITPQPGFISGADRKKAQQPIAERIYFAHSDLSGISIFEEAFYWGTKAARQAMGV
jgi:hypothetical protein